MGFQARYFDSPNEGKSEGSLLGASLREEVGTALGSPDGIDG